MGSSVLKLVTKYILISLATSLSNYLLSLVVFERNFKMADCVTKVNTGFVVNIEWQITFTCFAWCLTRRKIFSTKYILDKQHRWPWHAAERWIWLFFCSCMAWRNNSWAGIQVFRLLWCIQTISMNYALHFNATSNRQTEMVPSAVCNYTFACRSSCSPQSAHISRLIYGYIK